MSSVICFELYLKWYVAVLYRMMKLQPLKVASGICNSQGSICEIFDARIDSGVEG